MQIVADIQFILRHCTHHYEQLGKEQNRDREIKQLFEQFIIFFFAISSVFLCLTVVHSYRVQWRSINLMSLPMTHFRFCVISVTLHGVTAFLTSKTQERTPLKLLISCKKVCENLHSKSLAISSTESKTASVFFIISTVFIKTFNCSIFCYFLLLQKLKTVS